MAIPFVREFDDLAEAIATPPTNRPISRAIGNFGRSVCNRISANPGVFAPTILQSPLKLVCQPYWDAEGFDGPVEESSFTGGQCVGSYNISHATFTSVVRNCAQPEFTASQVITGSVFATNVLGPILSITTVLDTPGQCGPRFARARIVTATTELLITITNAGSTGDELISAPISYSVQRVDGPDNCGDPPGQFVPGANPAPDPGPLPVGTGPQFDTRGNPIFVVPPSLEIAPNINIEIPPGEVNLGSGTGNGPAQTPAAGDAIAGEGGGAGGGETDFGEPPEGERWVGCCVNIISSPVGQGIIQASLPQPIYPTTVGNVRLKFQGPQSPVVYDTPIVKRQQSTCIWEPVRGLAPVGCFVNLLPGFSYSVTPYSVPLEQ